jgi:superfamily I DNA and/or RNA helicase
MEEAAEVVRLIEVLVGSGAVRCEDIAVITPYRAQASTISSSLSERAGVLSTVEVDTVEKFQGREKRVVLFSVVRSNPLEQASYRPQAGTAHPPVADATHEIGFVENMRRLNVGISRAQSLMVVVGNATTLSGASEIWRDLVTKFRRRGAYTGP